MSAVTVSVMFSDLVGSTETLVRVGEGPMEALRRELFGILRDAVSDHRGDEVKNLGDGLMFVFPSASDLVEGAVAVQQRLDARNRNTTEPLAVRIGLATGDADVADDDYFGAAVVEAARLCAAADGGQILATETVQLLSRQRTDHEFVALGARAYKGFDQPIPVCEVTWEPLTAEALGVPLPARLERPPGAPFVGRATEQTVLLDALKEASVSGGRHVLVSGEAGIGKTTLLAAFARAAHDQGAIVMYGRCDEDLSIPYEPWRDILAHLDKHFPSAVDENRDALSILLSGAESQSSGMDADAARYILYNAVVDSLARASSVAPVVVVLEDLHWADVPTVALTRHIAQSTVGHGMLVATFREAELDTEHPLTATLAALHREQRVERLPLRGLNDLEVLALLETLAGHEMDQDGLALRDALRAETDGNPFFTTEILRHLAETGAITQRDDGQWAATTDLRAHGLPVSVREVIGLRVARLGDDTRQVLRQAAVIGRDFDLSLLAELVDLDDDTVHALLVPAVEAAVVTDVAPNQFSFTHALIGHALYDELTATTRARAHHKLGEALERRLGDDAGPRAAELAHHWELATTLHDAQKVAEYSRRAGAYALSQLAPDDAVGWFEKALELADPGDSRGRCELLVCLGEAQRQAGVPAYRETLLDACRTAISIDARELLVRGALANSRGAISESGADDRIAMLRAAIATEPGGTDAALLDGQLAEELFGQDIAESHRIARRALSRARETGNDRTFARVTWLVVATLRNPGTVEERGVIMQHASQAAARLGDPSTSVWIEFMAQSLPLELGDREESDRRLANVLPYIEKVKEPFLHWLVTFEQSVRRMIAGDLESAESLAEQALDLGLSTGQPNAFGIYAGQLFEIRRAQGRLAEVFDRLEPAATNIPGIRAFQAGLAVAYCELDRPDDADRLLDVESADGFERYPFDYTWTTAMLYWAEVCAYLDRREQAELLAEKIAPWRAQVAYSAATCGGSVARGLGLVLATSGRHDEAVDAFEEALRVNERLEAPIFVARTELDLACTLRVTEPSRARDLATSAASTAARLGLGTIERRTQSLLDGLR